jgi:hypothetical protein
MSRDDWRVYTSTGEDGTEYTVYDWLGPTLPPYEPEPERVGYPARCVQCEAPCPCEDEKEDEQETGGDDE